MYVKMHQLGQPGGPTLIEYISRKTISTLSCPMSVGSWVTEVQPSKISSLSAYHTLLQGEGPIVYIYIYIYIYICIYI